MPGSLAAAVLLLPLAWWLLLGGRRRTCKVSASRELLVAGAAVPPGILLAGLTGVLRGLGPDARRPRSRTAPRDSPRSR